MILKQRTTKYCNIPIILIPDNVNNMIMVIGMHWYRLYKSMHLPAVIYDYDERKNKTNTQDSIACCNYNLPILCTMDFG